MNPIATTMAKLAGLQKIVRSRLEDTRSRYFDPPTVLEYFEAYNQAAATLRAELPDLFAEIPDRQVPESSGTTDFGGRGYIERHHLERVVRDIDYIFEVRSHRELEVPTGGSERARRVFITHGRAPEWREVQAYVEKDLQIPTLELAQEPSRGRTILQKLNEESERCSYALIVMTGEDKTEEGQLRARENVIHEVGYFQGRFGLASVCLLHEEGVNIPSNIHGLVYIPFPRGMVSAAFGALAREIRAAFK